METLRAHWTGNIRFSKAGAGPGLAVSREPAEKLESLFIPELEALQMPPSSLLLGKGHVDSLGKGCCPQARA